MIMLTMFLRLSLIKILLSISHFLKVNMLSLFLGLSVLIDYLIELKILNKT